MQVIQFIKLLSKSKLPGKKISFFPYIWAILGCFLGSSTFGGKKPTRYFFQGGFVHVFFFVFVSRTKETCQPCCTAMSNLFLLIFMKDERITDGIKIQIVTETC